MYRALEVSEGMMLTDKRREADEKVKKQDMIGHDDETGVVGPGARELKKRTWKKTKEKREERKNTSSPVGFEPTLPKELPQTAIKETLRKETLKNSRAAR